MPRALSFPGNLPNLTMTYLDLVSSHIEKNGGSPELIAVVRDYLKTAHPRDEPPWSAEFDEICQRAVAFANSKLSAYASTSVLPKPSRQPPTAAIGNP
jgi:hypothetical protein